MVFSLNGVALDNPTFGWRLRAPSKPLSTILKRVLAVPLPDRDGQLTLPGHFDPVPIRLMVECPREQYETLLALVSATPLVLSREAVPGRVVACTLTGTGYDGYGDAEAILDVTIALQLDGPHWRDATEQTVEVVLGSSVEVSCFPGLSAPVGDALVRVTGPTSTVQFANLATGAAVAYPVAIASGKALVYDMDTESAALVNAGQWSGGVDVSGALNVQGPRLTVTPVFGAGPEARSGRLQVDAAGVSGASRIAVRGRGAYLVG